jgi:putative PIN family toxin of toxin-antitoxin system
MRVILDTNIFVSGIHWKNGPSGRVIDLWLDNKFELIISQSIIDEIVETLSDFKINLSFNDIIFWVSVLADYAVFVEPLFSLEVIKDDKDDNKFLEAGVEGNADYIISQDNHLLKLKEFKGIKIIKPEEFLRIINKL